MGSLNFDIFQSIIDQLHDDKSTLATSSLVARSWLSACRYHLFSKIRVYGYDPESKTVEVDSFVAFVGNTPSVCGYVRHLEIQGQKPQLPKSNSRSIPTTSPHWQDPTCLSPLFLSTCFTVITKFPNLVELTLSKACIIADGNLLCSFPSVVGLCLSNIWIPNLKPSLLTCWDVVRPFCNLQSLRLVRVVSSSSETRAESPSFPKLPLRHLTLLRGDDHWQYSVLQYLLRMHCLTSIVSLDISSSGPDSLTDVVTQYGGQILELSLHPFIGMCSCLPALMYLPDN